MEVKSARNVLVTLLEVFGSGAIFGGGVLIVSPSGALIAIIGYATSGYYAKY